MSIAVARNAWVDVTSASGLPMVLREVLELEPSMCLSPCVCRELDYPQSAKHIPRQPATTQCLYGHVSFAGDDEHSDCAQRVSKYHECRRFVCAGERCVSIWGIAVTCHGGALAVYVRARFSGPYVHEAPISTRLALCRGCDEQVVRLAAEGTNAGVSMS
jgi:hypothetical protein